LLALLKGKIQVRISYFPDLRRAVDPCCTPKWRFGTQACPFLQRMG